MQHRVPARAASLLVLAATLAACAKKQEAPPAPPAPPTVTITAADFAFSAPDTIPAGVVKLICGSEKMSPAAVRVLSESHILVKGLEVWDG